MKELSGKYGNAKVFTDLVEQTALDQISTLLDQEFIKDSQIRIMPDVHAGAGCTIGTTMTITDKCCPNLVGVDIGCGMSTTMLYERNIDLELLDQSIHEFIPSGFNIRNTEHVYVRKTHLEELICYKAVNVERAKLSIGTLGGGNHFIEVDKDDEGHLYLVVHSGSRHLGLEVAGYYQHLAEKQLCGRDKDSVRAMINDLNCMFMFGVDDFETVHNYIDTNDMILRKGAVSAKAGKRLLIPINMRDGSLICRGKGNPDWNYSAPHGAGRLMSRNEAKKKFSMGEFYESMNGIYTTSVNSDTLDECPMAYKPIESIVDNIGDTVEIEKIIRPIYNFKASE